MKAASIDIHAHERRRGEQLTKPWRAAVHELRAELDRHERSRVANRPHAPTNAGACFQDGHVDPVVVQGAGGGESCGAGANHEYLGFLSHVLCGGPSGPPTGFTCTGGARIGHYKAHI